MLEPTARDKEIFSTMVFMQDGAPPHYKLEVRRWLNAKFPGRWMGRQGSAAVPTPIRWMAYSPDLTPCDFFLWGYIKDQVYKKGMPKTLAELRERITAAFDEMPQEMINRAIDAYKTRLERCVEVEGKSVEQTYGQ